MPVVGHLSALSTLIDLNVPDQTVTQSNVYRFQYAAWSAEDSLFVRVIVNESAAVFKRWSTQNLSYPSFGLTKLNWNRQLDAALKPKRPRSICIYPAVAK